MQALERDADARPTSNGRARPIRPGKMCVRLDETAKLTLQQKIGVTRPAGHDSQLAARSDELLLSQFACCEFDIHSKARASLDITCVRPFVPAPSNRSWQLVGCTIRTILSSTRNWPSFIPVLMPVARHHAGVCHLSAICVLAQGALTMVSAQPTARRSGFKRQM